MSKSVKKATINISNGVYGLDNPYKKEKAMPKKSKSKKGRKSSPKPSKGESFKELPRTNGRRRKKPKNKEWAVPEGKSMPTKKAELRAYIDGFVKKCHASGISDDNVITELFRVHA